MNTDNTLHFSLDFSADELWFLMTQFGPAFIMGMENPYLGFLADEIEEATRKAVHSLIERDIARQISEDSIEVDEVVAAMVQSCVHPQHTLIVQSVTAGKGVRRFIHFSSDAIVEHLEEETGNHRLTAIRDRDALGDHLQDALRLETETGSDAQPFRLTEQALFEVSELLMQGKHEDAGSLLAEADLEKGIQQRLTAALSDPVANASFAVVMNRNDRDTQHIRGFAFLEGKDDLWLLRPVEQMGQPQVEFQPGNAEAIRRRFEEILP